MVALILEATAVGVVVRVVVRTVAKVVVAVVVVVPSTQPACRSLLFCFSVGGEDGERVVC